MIGFSRLVVSNLIDIDIHVALSFCTSNFVALTICKKNHRNKKGTAINPFSLENNRLPVPGAMAEWLWHPAPNPKVGGSTPRWTTRF